MLKGSLLTCFLICCLLVTGSFAQDSKTTPASDNNQKPSDTTPKSPFPGVSDLSESDYRIGVGDLLEIKVLGVDQLSRDLRVDNRGFITMPRLDEPIKASCLTEEELETEIINKYSKYLNNPRVDVSVKEFLNLQVAVIGAVHQTGRFQLKRRIRLLELLTYCGGLAESAGTNITIVHNDELASCEIDKNPRPNFESIPVEELLRNDNNANFYVKSGDIINVPQANIITIAGNVNKPGSLPLTGTMTITRAIALSGGVKADTAKNKIRIVRQTPGAADTEIAVDLTAIEKRKSDDVELHVNDIVIVPDSNTTLKNVGRAMLNTLAVGIAGAPVRVIQ